MTLWRRKWQPTPVFLPGKSHGQRSLGGYSPWGRKESDTTEPLSTAQMRPHDLDPNYAQNLTKELKEEVENGTVLVSLLSVTALVSF